MAKFLIQCPHCGTYQQASTSLFARKVIECSCGKLIDIKKERHTIRTCPHCGNSVMYDQAKGTNAICPICKESLVSESDRKNIAHIHCPSCFCDIQVDKNAVSYECPLCNTKIKVQEQITKEEIKAKGMASVIKYEGLNDVFVWKHPIEDFNIGSQLIVHESQEAIFFRDGQALDLFGAGRHLLETGKLPIIDKLYKLPTNGSEVFHSEVYFVNMVTQTGIKWGTDSKVRMFDPASGLSVELGACGEFNLQVVNSRKLLLKLVGTTSTLKVDKIIDSNPYSFKSLTGKFKALLVLKVKSVIAKVIRDNNINILEVDSYLEHISLCLKNELNAYFEEYGLHIPEFFVTNILTPDDDPNFRKMKEQYAEQYLLVRQEQIRKNVALAEQQRKIVEAQTGAQIDIIQAQAQAEAYRLKAEAEAKEMQMKGYTYQQETQRQVGLAAMENLGNAGNGGSNVVGGMSSLIGEMAGLGVGIGVATQVASTVKENVTPIMQNATSAMNPNVTPAASVSTWNCTCGTTSITSLFCPNCGQKRPLENLPWTCPNCGKAGINSKFCPDCGTKKGE